MLEQVNDMIVLARACIGVSKYRLRSRPIDAPKLVDCSSFSQWLYGVYGIQIPRLAYQQFEVCQKTTTPREAFAGSLVFRRHFFSRTSVCPVLSVGHVGVITDVMTVIHASKSAGGVVEDPLEDFYAFTSSVVAAGIPARVCTTTHIPQEFVWRSNGLKGRDKRTAGST